MPGRVTRPFAHGLFGNGSSAFKGRERLFFIVQKGVDRALEEFSGLIKVRGILWQFLYNRERVGEFSLQQQKLHTCERDESVWIDTWRHFGQLFFHHAKISFPINRKLRLFRARAK